MSDTKAVAKRNTTVDLDKAVIIHGKDGQEVRRIKTFLNLSVEEGTLVKIQNAKKAWGDQPAQPPMLIPTATAWMKIAAQSGLALRHPETVVVGGKEMPNGFCDENGTYYYRAQCGGYTDLGQPFITERTVDFNVHRYNIQDLLAKAKQKENAKFFKVMPYRGKDSSGGFIGGPKEGDWAPYQIDEAVVLWVDCSCPDFVRWLGEMNNRIKNAVRICQTFADRNAIAAHPATPVKRKFSIPQVSLPCVSWYAQKGQIDFRLLTEGGKVEIDVAASTITDDPEVAPIVKAEVASDPIEPADAVEEDEDNLPMGSQEPPVGAAGGGEDDKDADQKKELLDSIATLKKYKTGTYKKAVKDLDLPDDISQAPIPALIQLQQRLVV
jgi:hypothetical protein